jgi:glycosyltransferase involved in cell wall biosynthesis
MQPLLSIVVICFNMRREALRSLHSMSRKYQRGVQDLAYEVIVVDNGSSAPLAAEDVAAFGPEFSYVYRETTSPSPVAALNEAVRASRGKLVMLCIDGARMLSPGMLRFSVLGARLSDEPIVTALAWHLGDKVQKIAMQEGYNQEVEDNLLKQCDWRSDGYELFNISCLANSSRRGWFHPISESSCLTMSKHMFGVLGGYDEAFVSPGGGYANLDFYKRACEAPSVDLVMLLGEGSFHQFHGGAATNAPLENHPGQRFAEEYERLRGQPYSSPKRRPIYLGTLPRQARGFMVRSVKDF